MSMPCRLVAPHSRAMQRGPCAVFSSPAKAAELGAFGLVDAPALAADDLRPPHDGVESLPDGGVGADDQRKEPPQQHAGGDDALSARDGLADAPPRRGRLDIAHEGARQRRLARSWRRRAQRAESEDTGEDEVARRHRQRGHPGEHDEESRGRADEDGGENPEDPRRRRNQGVAADRAHVPLPAEVRHEAALAPARERHRVETVANKVGEAEQRGEHAAGERGLGPPLAQRDRVINAPLP
mmetsp:Transcript_44910/g.148851  ORF Transcript_44910/g.148851 Transcript_44910/m.148851 type:complete len:240 (-) Transcript_44910:94-813(-)